MKRLFTLIALLVLVASATAQTKLTSPWQLATADAYKFAMELNQYNAICAKSTTDQMKLDSLLIDIWGIKINELFIYDGLGRLIEIKALGTDSLGALINEARIVLAYDASGRLHIVTTYLWDVPTLNWLFEQRDSYSYTGPNLINEILSESWDLSNNVWVNMEKTVYTHNAQNLTATETLMEWVVSYWINSNRLINGYNGTKITYSVDQFWSGSSWTDSDSTYFAYDGSSQLREELSFYWMGSAWQKSEKITHHYIAPSKRDTIINYYWNQSDLYWNPIDMKVSTFDSNGDFDEVISFTYDSFDSLWTSNFREWYDYDVNYTFSDLVLPTYAMDLDVPLSQMFSHKLDMAAFEIGANGNWFPLGQAEFHYSVFTPFGLEEHSASEIIVYPNPIVDWLTINAPDAATVYVFELFTSTGQLLLKSEVQGETLINTSELPHGVYVWQMQPVIGNGLPSVRGKLLK